MLIKLDKLDKKNSKYECDVCGKIISRNRWNSNF